MEVYRNTRQEDDPNGLRAIDALLQHGTSDDFEELVLNSLPAVNRVRSLLERVREFQPGVEFSPYVMRALSIAEKAESARLAVVA